MTEAIAVICARGGSRGIPRKNLAPVAGRPLIQWTIESARQSRAIRRVVVSTDCTTIAAVARGFGAEVPFLRPASLARDDTPGIAPLLDALDRVAAEESPLPEWVVQLQPTSPLRIAQDIDRALELAHSTASDSVVSVTEAPCHPFWTRSIDAAGRLHPFLDDTPTITTRQALPEAFALNGAVYAAKIDALRNRGDFQGPNTVAYVMPSERSIDIDTPYDLALADWLLRRQALSSP